MQGFRASIPLIAVCAALIGAFASESTKIKPILAELRSHEPRYVEELKQLVAFPSISASSARLPDLLKAADWLAQRLTAAGLQNVKTLSNPEGPRPSVYGEFIADASLPTALIYGHYDVQPADPEAAWTSPPFSPQVRNGSLYGRGASDNKGGLLAAIQAVEGILKVQGNLPINVKFLLEGEEEVGSPHLEPFLEAHRDALACDFVLSSDGEQQSATQPTIPIGLRGAVALEVEVAALGVDVHSGTWGGAVQNPNRGLVQLLATMVDPTTNKVLIKGFYDKYARV